MENKLEIFKNDEFGKLMILIENGKQYIEASEVAKVLGYANPQKAIRDHCKKDGVLIRSVGVQTGYKRDGTPAMQNIDKKFINEGNLYRLITHSKLPNAEKFESWVFDEVLPSIRKTGGYIYGEEIMNEDQLIMATMNVLNKKIEKLQIENSKQTQLIEEQKPKVLFADSVCASESSVLIGELAKILKQNGIDIGQNRLFHWLRENGFLIKSGESKNLPTQKGMNLELFEIKERTHFNPDGSSILTRTTKITPKGQIYFINKFLNQCS